MEEGRQADGWLPHHARGAEGWLQGAEGGSGCILKAVSTGSGREAFKEGAKMALRFIN